MKRYSISKISILAFSLFFMVNAAECQILKKIREEMAVKPNSESAESDGENGLGGIDLAGMMGQTKDFKAPSEYSFDFQVTMEMQMEKGKSMTQVWKYNTADSYFGMEMSNMLIIYDLDSDVMVTLNPKDKTYTAMNTAMMGMFGNAADEEEDNIPEMRKTSETKTILGYTATKYIMENEDLKGEFWMAPDVEFDQSAFAKSLGSYSKNQVPLPEKMQGFMMEMTAFDKKGKVTSTMKVVQLGEINEVIDLGSYKNGMSF
ncbi:hypothetical protein SAMN04489724_0247 [Algoriphagus locisalis]|uniref:DUF4412 domain-containing protein n=1 Tax=Algoriphagus locisalis TaxID=305507 RepID=A0A1I7E869_9BACT|nr:DUF4412 domain-containing protein [Algoriphagus locisalis]SFU20130.1 hypothetical protein SAMN04489724_0247 [Algoriphagus locisalis]